MKGIGKLHDERRDEHRAAEEEGIDSREQSGDQKDRSDELGSDGHVPEHGGEVIARHVGGEGGGASVSEDFRGSVGEEDRSRAQTEKQRGDVRRPSLHGAMLLAPISLFVSVYVATFLALGLVARGSYWTFLLAAAAATLACVALIERGAWSLGLFVPLRLATPEFAAGALLAAVIIGLTDLLVIASTPIHHLAGSGFPWRELLLVYIPAAVHEELFFRGYMYQKLRQASLSLPGRAARRHAPFAIVASAAAFALLHGGNRAVTPLAMLNIFIAGVLLALAYDRYERLWFPIGIHLVWNLSSGPILGYDISGYVPGGSVLRTVGSGAGWLTGGAFGIEGSLWITLLELGGVAWLFSRPARRAS